MTEKSEIQYSKLTPPEVSTVFNELGIETDDVKLDRGERDIQALYLNVDGTHLRITAHDDRVLIAADTLAVEELRKPAPTPPPPEDLEEKPAALPPADAVEKPSAEETGDEDDHDQDGESPAP